MGFRDRARKIKSWEKLWVGLRDKVKKIEEKRLNIGEIVVGLGDIHQWMVSVFFEVCVFEYINIQREVVETLVYL